MSKVLCSGCRGAVPGRKKKAPSDSSTGTIHHHHQHQQPRDHQVQTPQQGPSEPPQIMIENNEGENVPEDEPRLPESGWVISIKEKLKQAGQDNSKASWTKLSIYRIPHYLKDGKHKAYIPQIVSLGPYHHDKKHLRQMDWHKWRCLQRILQRTKHKIVHYIDKMKKVEKEARACYEGTISMSSDKFVEMMVLDGCFVIELFQIESKGSKELGYRDDDPIFSMGGSLHMIQRDMIMLENQIPFFILDELYRLQTGHPDGVGDLAKLALQFFNNMKPVDETLTERSQDMQKVPNGRVLHCLELFRWSLMHPDSNKGKTGEPSNKGQQQQFVHCVTEHRKAGMEMVHSPDGDLLHPDANKGKTEEPSNKGQQQQFVSNEGKTKEPSNEGQQQQFVHCVTELRKARIEFRKTITERFLDIQLKDGILQIPQIMIHDGTRSLFLNLIAWEQCHFPCSNEITSYVIFMDNLINSPEDIEHLHDCGIIEHWLGSDAEVADLFNQLCQEVAFDMDESYLSEQFGKVNRYSSNWNRWKFILKNEYFSNPWSIISFIAAFVLLVLTLAQTFFGVYGYFRLSS